MKDLALKSKNHQYISVMVKYFNKDFFETKEDCVNSLGLILQNFQNSNFDNFIDFVRDSEKNNHFINDYLVEQNFTIKNDKIIFRQKNQKIIWENCGTLLFYKMPILPVEISFNGSSLFIDDKLSGKQYLYYAD